MKQIEALWEVPLGVMSFVFSRLLRSTLTNLGRYYNPMNTQEVPQWQVVSAEFLQRPIKLLWAMSRARWNLHALIAIAGPFTVEQSISIRVATIAEATPTWTAVFYTLGNFKTLANISSLSISGENEWETVTLPPGRYLVGLRHYHWADPLTLPEIRVDGKDALAAQPMVAPKDANRFYRTLIQRQGLIHQALNGYVYPLLRYPLGLPKQFVRDVFLPVPNPETQFHYGALQKGEVLKIQLPEGLLDTHELFFSLYNRFCFPLDWYPLTTQAFVTERCDRKSVFIIRIHPKSRAVQPPDPETIQLQPIAAV
jgi:hypothetical protein